MCAVLPYHPTGIPCSHQKLIIACGETIEFTSAERPTASVGMEQGASPLHRAGRALQRRETASWTEPSGAMAAPGAVSACGEAMRRHSQFRVRASRRGCPPSRVRERRILLLLFSLRERDRDRELRQPSQVSWRSALSSRQIKGTQPAGLVGLI